MGLIDADVKKAEKKREIKAAGRHTKEKEGKRMSRNAHVLPFDEIPSAKKVFFICKTRIVMLFEVFNQY